MGPETPVGSLDSSAEANVRLWPKAVGGIRSSLPVCAALSLDLPRVRLLAGSAGSWPWR